MRNKVNSWIVRVATSVTIAVGLTSSLSSQPAELKSTGSTASGSQWSVQVARIDPGDMDLARSFEMAIYENLVQELNKTKQFKHVVRDGDGEAAGIPDLLVLKTTVVKYTAGSETRRAVTTVSGATKLTVRTQLLTRDGKTILDRTVQGNVRFFGTNLRATHNLARNIAKMMKQSLPTSDRLARQSLVNPAKDGVHVPILMEANVKRKVLDKEC
jgi:hypothetical protein